MPRHTPYAVFDGGLQAIGVGPGEFARIFGLDPRNARRWAQDGEDIPFWVGPALAALTAPGALDLARAASQHLKARSPA